MAAKTADMVEVGRRLRELRERVGMPKEQVALAFRMSAGNWAHYESGRNQLAVTQLPPLADLYGMTLTELVQALFSLPDGADTVIQSDESLEHDETSKVLLIKSRLITAGGFLPAHAPIRELAFAGA